MPNVTVALTSAMQTQLQTPGVTGWAVYFNANGTTPVWQQLTGLTATVPLTLPEQKGLKLYFILQSTDSAAGAGNSVQLQITTESQIAPVGPPTSAQALNYRYDSFEVTFTPAAADAGNLTDINGFGIPMAVEVVYTGTTPTTSASRGYLISGGTVGSSGGIWNALASAGGSGSIQYFSSIGSGGYATTQPRMAISPATAIGNNAAGTTYSASQWDGYISSLTSGSTSSATTSGGAGQIQVAGYFNGAPDGNHVWHNAGFYAYNVTTSGGNFVLTPGATSQIQGTITITAADLANSIYMTLGNATVSGLANVDGTGNNSTLTMNTGANNEWGAVLRDFIAGFTGGYWNATATSLNSQITTPLVLNKEWNQDPTYAFGGTRSSGQPGFVTSAIGGFYDPYAKVFFEFTNSYGNGYSDFLTRAFDVGPLINVSDGSGNAVDSNNITVTLFADTDTPTGYTSQTINNYLPPGSGGYLVPSGVSSSGITTQLNFNIGTMSLASGTPITIVLKGATSASDVVLPTISGFGNYQVTSGGGGYVMSNTGGTVVTGIINITDLPVTAASSGTGVNWYQIEVGSGTAQKIFNLYETVNTAGQILNPAYTGSGAVPNAIAIDGLATAQGNGTGQYIANTTGQIGISFQTGGNNTLDPSLLAVVPLPAPVSSGAPPLGIYPQPTAVLVGMRPGYTSGAGAPFLESYQVWNAQSSSTASSGSASWTVPTSTPQTVYNGGLVFGWNGADSAAVQQQAATSNYYVNALTNKIAGGDVARLTFTSVSGAALPSEIVSNGGYLTATADADGNWATAAPVQFGNGVYTVQMQEFLASDSTFANPLNSASAVQSFTVQQGAVISSYNLSVDTGQTSAGLTIVSSGASSGALTVNSGGTASASMISAGGIMYMAGGSGDTGSIILGQHQVWSGATAGNTTVARGGADYVYGTTSAASVNGSGAQIIGGGGGATSATASGTTLNSGGYQHVKSAGWASNTAVLSGGNQIVDGGGFAMNTTVYVGGIMHVSSGGSAGSSYISVNSSGVSATLVSGGAVVSGGALHVLSGGVTLGALLQGSGAAEKAWSGGSAASTTVQSSTYLYVYSGGFSIAATIQAGGVEDVWGSGSIASNATVQSAGYEYVYAAGSAVNATLQSGGQQWVWDSGTTATGTTILGGATMVVHGGGVASGIVVNGGSAAINSGGTVSGATLNGGVLEISSNGLASGTIQINTSGSTVKLQDSVHLNSSSFIIAGLTPTAGAIDFADIGFTSGVTTSAWAQSGTSGTLTLTSGALQASVMLFGTYVASSFKLASDGAHGTLVTDPAVGADPQNLLTQPHA